MTDDLLTGTVSNIAFGGEGIIRNEGLVTFIPYAAIGDQLSYRIKEQKKNFAKGEIVNILQPSPQRTEPLCPYYGICGGCQLQHVNYDAQLEYKRQWVEDALKRQAGFTNITVPAVTPTEQQWTYRRRISLTLKADFNHYLVGYINIDHTTLVEVDQCPIFLAKEDQTISNVREIANHLESCDRHDGKVSILKQDNDKVILHFHFKNMPTNAAEILNGALKSYPQITGILATSPKETLHYGKIETTFTIENLSFIHSPQAFVQNHPEQSANIYQSICKHTDNLPKGNALDLYSGIGVTSLLLAKQGFNVTATEMNGSAVQLAKLNAKNNRISNVVFHKKDVEAVIASQLKERNPVLAIINPPREGVALSTIEAILKAPPAVFIYISCMPPTLARDLKLLCKDTYNIDSIETYDMFPQTAHVETLVVLKKK